jgi:hypothetical protein
MLDCMAHGGSGDDLVDEYLTKDLAVLFKIERAMTFWQQAMLEIDNRCDVKLAPFILRHFRTNRLFHSFSHCTSRVLRYLLSEMIRYVWKEGVPDSHLDFVTTNRLNNLEVPVHPSLARALGLEWYRDDMRYRHYENGSFTLREYMCRYIRYDHGK